MCWLLYLCLAVTVSAQEKLVFAVDIIRHGDRSPINNLLGENPGSWPEGFAQLTELGKKQEYTNGLVLRKLYCPGLFDASNAAQSICVFSTDLDRTRMSAQALLKELVGLAAPSVPIYTSIPININAAISPTNAIRAEKLFIPDDDPDYYQSLMSRYVLTHPEWIATNKTQKPQMARWGRAMGRRISSIADLIGLGDALYACRIHQHTMPKGLSPDDVEAMISAGHWARVFQSRGEIGRITGGPLLGKIAQYMKKAHDEELSLKNDRLKYILLSAHDATLLSVMSALGAPLTGDNEPPYAAYLHFGLFEKDRANFNIQITYHDDQDHVVTNRASGGVSWSLDQFLKEAGQ